MNMSVWGSKIKMGAQRKWGSLSFFGELSLCGKEGQGGKGVGR